MKQTAILVLILLFIKNWIARWWTLDMNRENCILGGLIEYFPIVKFCTFMKSVCDCWFVLQVRKPRKAIHARRKWLTLQAESSVSCLPLKFSTWKFSAFLNESRVVSELTSELFLRSFISTWNRIYCRHWRKNKIKNGKGNFG